jgi:glycosyltransferase involved in cell wall biosynthesis
LRLLHSFKIFQPDADGGIPTAMSCLAQNTNDTAIHSILTARPFGLGRRYIVDGVPVHAVASFGTVHTVPLSPGYIPAYVLAARQTDVAVHNAPFPWADAAIWVGLPRRVALVVFWHADIIGHPLFKRLMNPLRDRVLARADRIVVSGSAMIENSDLLKSYKAKCEVVPFGIDLDYWRTLDAADIAEINEIKRLKPRHIVAVGRLVNYKGFDVLLRAMCSVDASATIIGEGTQYRELQKLAAQLGISGRVHFPGRLDRRDVKRLMHSAQVYALPSVNSAEAFGIVQIEAMASGLPIVNTRLNTAVPLVARHNQEALTVEPNDPDAFAQALNSLLNQPDLARRLGAAGYIRATEEFAQDVFRARMAAVYEAAIQARKSHVEGYTG